MAYQSKIDQLRDKIGFPKLTKTKNVSHQNFTQDFPRNQKIQFSLIIKIKQIMVIIRPLKSPAYFAPYFNMKFDLASCVVHLS